MTNQFSQKVSEVLTYSREEAIRLLNINVMPEHLLLGILREKHNPLTQLFIQSHVDVDGVKNELENMVKKHSIADSTMPTEKLELDERASNILKLSVLEARLQHRQTVELEHVILAILHDKVPNGAKEILENHGINYNNSLKSLALTNNSSIANNSIQNGIGISEEDFDTIENNDKNEKNDHKPSDNTGWKVEQKKGGSATPVLDKFSVDLTAAARDGKLDPMVGREKEIMRVTEILCRRKKNNPILIGEPGVGKSAIAEGLAQLIVERHTSPLLFNKRILRLDLTSIVAGTKYRGQFEERIQALIHEIESNPDIIVFIDEIHTIIGAGSTPGSMDAANIMKPALTRGQIQCIGATTLDEYRNSIEKDGALERRFQRVMIEPTTEEQTLHILRNVKERYEDHHHVIYSDEALQACVKLTARYVTERQLPDKAIDALDEVGAKVHLQYAQTPSEIKEMEQQLVKVKEQKESAAKHQQFEMAAAYRDNQCKLEQQLKHLNEEWFKNDNGHRHVITEDDVAAVVAFMSGIPIQKISESENTRLRHLSPELKASIIAQDGAIDKIVRSIQRNRLGLKDPNHPIGVFMFLGPTGVGKTYLAQKLAETMFGTKDALIRIDMSEYSEKFNTSRLVGAPPGYVGYGEGGQLTEKVRRHPYSIVLLDEIEKAHGDVYNLLLQVLDEGRMTDGNGRMVDFRNTIIIMTSNAGTRQLKEFSHSIGFNALSVNGDVEGNKEYARSVIQKSLSKQFAPEFLNRIDEIITFDPLDHTAIRKIVDIELEKLNKRMQNIGYTINVSDNARDFLAAKAYDVQYGARPLKRAIQTYVEDELCEYILSESIQTSKEICFDKIANEDKLSISVNSDTPTNDATNNKIEEK